MVVDGVKICEKTAGDEPAVFDSSGDVYIEAPKRYNAVIMNYWIIVASKDHLQRGLAGGFIQANHGKAAPLQRMHLKDWVIFYSPTLEFGKPAKCQCFTAIGRIADEDIYQHDMGGGFVPFRRKVNFLPAQDVPILPILKHLTFIKDKKNWGAPFRFGTLQIPEQDFQFIASKMVENQSLLEG